MKRDLLSCLKQLLIPLCHSFILLPVCAILGGAPGQDALTAILGMLMGFSMVGWLMNLLVPSRLPLWIPSVLLAVIGMICGLSFLPTIWCSLTDFAPRDWLGIVMGLSAGAVMIWTQQECYQGLAHGMPNYELGIGMVLYIFTYFAYRADGSYITELREDLYQPIYLFGAIWMVLAIIVMNYQHINRMAATKNHPRAPRNVLILNILFSLIMVTITIVFSHFGLLRRLVSYLFQQLINLLFPQIEYDAEPNEEGPTELVEEEEGGKFEWTRPLWVQITLLVISSVIVIAVIAFIVWVCLENRAGRKKRSKDGSYEEEEESLMDWGTIKNNLKKRFRRTKGTDFEDQPNARMQVRWLYARLRDELRRREKYNGTLTPNEQARTQFPAQENAYQLTELYNRARYSEQDIHEEEALSGRKYLEEMLKNGGGMKKSRRRRM